MNGSPLSRVLGHRARGLSRGPIIVTFRRQVHAASRHEVHGSGFPLLLFAPGGLRSQLAYWRHSPSNPDAAPPWMNPMADLASRFTVIGMDQRNAGNSRGSVTETHGWHTYASDHLALMDHLGHRRFHVLGGCIGGSYCFTLCEMAPERVAGAVLQNPIGLHENRVSRRFVSKCSTPLLLQPGTDKPHPAATSAEIEKLAPNLEVQKDWRGPTHLAESIRRVGDFLTKHTP